MGKQVRDIHQRRNRTQPDGVQLGLQPLGRGSVLHATDQPAGKDMAAVLGILGNRHLDRAVTAGRQGVVGHGLQRAKAPRRQIPRHAPHPKRVGPVRGDGDLDHRVHGLGPVLRQPMGEFLTDLARGQLDDAVMFVRQLQLTLRRHHAVAFHAADFADGNGDIQPRDIHAWLGQHDGDAFARVRRTADDLLFTLVGLHHADPQLVRVRMLLGRGDLGDGKAFQFGGGVFDTFHFQTDVGQGFQDFLQGRGGLQVVFEPGQGEFHRIRQFVVGFVVRISSGAGRPDDQPRSVKKARKAQGRRNPAQTRAAMRQSW